MSAMESELTCSICLHIYQDPVVMSCMHSYCRECLKELHSKANTTETLCGEPCKVSNTLSCPDCRVTTSFGLEGVDGLPKNFTLANICRKFKEALRQSPTRSHEPPKQTPSEKKTLYCMACQVIVRSGDILSTHRYHVTEDLETAIAQRQARLSTSVQELERSRSKEDEKLKTASDEHCTRQEQIQKQEDEINSLAESIEERLRSRRKEVLEEIDSLKKHNKASFEAYKEQLQSYISTVDSITAAARALDGQSLDNEEGQAVFIQVAEDVLIRTQQLPNMVDVDLSHRVPSETYGETFAENLRGDFRTILGTHVAPSNTSLPPSKEDKPTEPSPVDDDHDISTGEEHHVDTESHTESEYSCRSENIMKGVKLEWDPGDCHSSLAISYDCLVVTNERWEDEEIPGGCVDNDGTWTNVCGIASNIVLPMNNIYWEILVTYAILSHLDDNDLITDLGICKYGKEDVHSPLNENYYCLCCSLFKDPDSSSIAMDFWDGPKKSTSESVTVKRIKRRKRESLRLGFNVDFLNKMFRIIDVDENKVLHTFENMRFPQVTAVASIENEDEVRTSLKLDCDFDVVPSILIS